MTTERQTVPTSRDGESIGRPLVWTRLDGPGTDIALLTTGSDPAMHGAVVTTRPVPYLLRYSFSLDLAGAFQSVEIDAEGGGWRRHLRATRDTSAWRVVTQESGNLDEVLTAAGRPAAPLPGIEDSARLDGTRVVWVPALPASLTALLRASSPGSRAAEEVPAALVLVPSLAVLPTTLRLSKLSREVVAVSESGHTTEVEVDADGDVLHCPGLARRVS